MKRLKTLTMRADEHVIHSELSPEPIDEFDGSCPLCHSPYFYEVLTIVQHGFGIDQCCTVMCCDACGEALHYQYEIDSPESLRWIETSRH